MAVSAKRPGGFRIDFLTPAGDPGLSGPGSVSWRVSANPISLAVGGIAAVLLELAEPRIRAGVWDHSTFKVDPIARMERTGLAAMAVTYGPEAAARFTFDRVTRMHQRVGGQTPDGQAYEAMQPDLLTWVHVTAAWGFLNAYVRHVDPGLSRADQDRYYAEGEVVARGFGASWTPTSVADVEAYMADMRPKLAANPTLGEFLAIVRNATPFGALARPLQRLITTAAIDLLPCALRQHLALPTAPRPLARSTITLLARTARATTPFLNGPAQQACHRMGVSTACLR